MLYAGDHVSSRPVLVIWVRMIQINLGNARVCPGLQATMDNDYNIVLEGIDWSSSPHTPDKDQLHDTWFYLQASSLQYIFVYMHELVLYSP